MIHNLKASFYYNSFFLELIELQGGDHTVEQ